MTSDDGLAKRFVGAITANSPLLILGAVVAFCVMAFVVYSMFRIDVPEAHVGGANPQHGQGHHQRRRTGTVARIQGHPKRRSA